MNKDFYPEYIAAKTKLTRTEKKFSDIKRDFYKKKKQYERTIQQLRNELVRIKGGTIDGCENIYDSILENFGITEDELKGRCRQRHIMNIRHALFYHMRYERNLTLTQIGKLFDRDHSTIINAVKNVEAWLDVPQIFKEELQILEIINEAPRE